MSGGTRLTFSARMTLATFGITAWIILSIAVSGSLKIYPGHRLGIIAINGMILGILLTSGLLLRLRS